MKVKVKVVDSKTSGGKVEGANLLEHLRNHAITWTAHRSKLAYKRLNEERTKLIQDVETAQVEIKRVEAQLYKIESNTTATKSSRDHPKASTCGCDRSSFLWIISGIVNGLLKLFFCIVFATLVHEAAPKLLKGALPVLVGTQLSSTLITCLVTAKYSTVGASIAGPDIIHALVLATMTGTVAQNTSDPDEALATVLFLICFTGACISLTWIVVARYKLMVVIDFFPVAVVTGFLGCVGYMVLKEAAHIAVGPFWYHPLSSHFWLLLLPALPVGIPMFVLKRFHIGSPLVSMPYYMFAPMIIFFISVASTSTSTTDLRSNGWLFEEFESGRFWEQWSKLNVSNIQWSAVLETLPDTFILVIIITLDAFLKLSATKDGLRCKMDMVQELYVLGFQNLLSVACVGSVGYSQVNFTMINYAITNKSSERRPTIIVALLCGILWFAGFPVINYVPRFFLAGLLVYASLPFLEMVVQAYWRVTKKEFTTILIILIVNAVTGLVEATKSRTLLIAVGVGFLLSAFTFILQYSKTSVLRDSLLGQDYQSSVVRAYEEQKLVERLGIRYAIVELEGYIFFGSCNQIIKWTKELTAENREQPNCKRVRYVTIDFKNVENVDYTGASSFRDVVDELSANGIDVLFSGCSPKVSGKLKQEGVFSALGVLVFSDLDHASEYVEKSLLERAAHVRYNRVETNRRMTSYFVPMTNYKTPPPPLFILFGRYEPIGYYLIPFVSCIRKPY
jgi:SulP family sulfate permease